MRPELAITHKRQSTDGHLVLSIDTKKASYQGHPWRDLNAFYRRKFENMVVLSHPMDRVKIVYG